MDSSWPPRSIAADALRAEEWSYLAEGGQNLLLRYVGPAPSTTAVSSPFVSEHGSLALRVLKRKRNGETDQDHASKSRSSRIESHDFQQDIVEPLIGVPEALPATVPIDLPPNNTFLRDLAPRIEAQRPARRRNTDEIDPDATRLWAVEDLTAGSASGGDGADQVVLTVEIKPKWLYRELPMIGPNDEDAQLKQNVSRYKMHRVHRHAYMSFSDWQALYDPPDLASYSPGRKRKALAALWREWRHAAPADDNAAADAGDEPARVSTGSQHTNNNLRIFLDGKLLAASDWPALAVPLSIDSHEDMVQQAFIDLLAAQLEASPLLTPLLTRLALAQCQHATEIAQLGRRWPGKDPFSLDTADGQLSYLLREPTLQELQAAVRLVPEDPSAAKHDHAALRTEILRYAVSATFKDCSLFVRFSGARGERARLRGTLKLVDLDPKPVARMRKWWQADREIVASFRDWMRRQELHFDKSVRPWRLVTS